MMLSACFHLTTAAKCYMRDDDGQAIERLLRRNPRINPHSVIALSGEGVESDICRELYSVGTRDIGRDEWDLDDAPHQSHRAGLGIVCNTFLCSTDPMRWLRNIAMAVPYLVIQDLADARRGGSKHVDPGSGDYQRYSVSSHGVIGQTDPEAAPVFDLSTSGAIVMDCESYSDGSYVKFAALLDLRPLRADGKMGLGSYLPLMASWLLSEMPFLEAALVL